MPVPLHQPENKSPKKKPGPKPTCECGDCPVCNNRKRQRRFYDRVVRGEKVMETRENDQI